MAVTSASENPKKSEANTLNRYSTAQNKIKRIPYCAFACYAPAAAAAAAAAVVIVIYLFGFLFVLVLIIFVYAELKFN